MPTTATMPTTQTMTAEEFFDWSHRPENQGRNCELVDGEIIDMSRPGERHGYVCANMTRILGNYTFERKQGYVLSNDTGLLLHRSPDTVRGPDVVLYLTTRRYDDLNIRYSVEMPTLAVEVLSPNDSWPQVTRRVSQFLARSVAVVWLVDPESRTLMMHRNNQLPQVFEGEDEFTCEEALPGLKFRTADLFYLPGESKQ